MVGCNFVKKCLLFLVKIILKQPLWVIQRIVSLMWLTRAKFILFWNFGAKHFDFSKFLYQYNFTRFILDLPVANCYFTRLNLKKWGLSNFAL